MKSKTLDEMGSSMKKIRWRWVVENTIMQISQVGCKVMEIWCETQYNRNNLQKIENSTMETNYKTHIDGNNYKEHGNGDSMQNTNQLRQAIECSMMEMKLQVSTFNSNESLGCCSLLMAHAWLIGLRIVQQYLTCSPITKDLLLYQIFCNYQNPYAGNDGIDKWIKFMHIFMQCHLMFPLMSPCFWCLSEWTQWREKATPECNPWTTQDLMISIDVIHSKPNRGTVILVEIRF